MANSNACSMKSSPQTSSPPPTRSATEAASPATTAPRSTTRSSISTTGAKTPSRSSASSASTPTTATTATTSSCSSTASPPSQIELKTLGINPRRAIEQIVEYKNDPGNGYTRTILCFVQLFIVTNRDSTYYFANNNARHFAFNADERFLPIYEHARPDNSKVKGSTPSPKPSSPSARSARRSAGTWSWSPASKSC